MIEEKILEAAATAFIAELSNEIKRAYHGVTAETRRIFETGTKDYIRNQYERFKYVKTILHGNTPKYFYEVYHPIHISNQKHTALTSSIKTTFEKSNYITVIGEAGSGKSTLAKHLFLQALSERKTIPLFIELRNLSNENNSIEESIKEKILEKRISESSAILERMLATGRFIFFLDGYDELSGEIKANITESINKFTEKYGKNKYLLTTRPYSDIDLLPLFHNYHIENLSENEIELFIEKQLNDEPELSRKIKQSIKDSKANYIKSFFRNPLLLSLYILTYQSNASIPTKKYVFYRRVINALFSEHDSKTKLGFERETKCKLQQEEFEKILKAFCFVSYFEGEYSFEYDQLTSRIQKIKSSISEIKFSPESFISDMKAAISLWVEDGGFISFAHRSLQEYFAALFIKDLDDTDKEKVYSKMINDPDTIHAYGEAENFLSLCEEMDEASFNKYYAIPTLHALMETLSGRDKVAKFLSFFATGINQYSVKKGTKPKSKFYPSINNVIYRSIYFHLPYTLQLHKIISEIDPAALFPEGIPQTAQKTLPYIPHYFNKTKGLKGRIVCELKKTTAPKICEELNYFINEDIARRSKNIAQQKKSNSELISLIS